MAEVDIIIPVYHPGQGWVQHLVDHFTLGLDTHNTYTLIVVNDGGPALSTEEKEHLLTLKTLNHFNKVIIDEYPQNKGKGHAVRKGIAQGKSEIVTYTDDDLPYGVEAINRAVQLISECRGVVIPYRESDYFHSLPWKRKWISKCLIWMNRYLMGLKHADTQAGFKALHREYAEVILNGRQLGFLFEVEWINNLEKMDVPILSIPIVLKRENAPSGVPGGDVVSLLKNYLKLLHSR
jgi:glycosyltransferase involved in cell wall biosynthesis